jgi:hypothetical protein
MGTAAKTLGLAALTGGCRISDALKWGEAPEKCSKSVLGWLSTDSWSKVEQFPL